MHPEQAAFEKAIDENPLEAANHLVYADWLDENGQPDEAAFRRAMGKWVPSFVPADSNNFPWSVGYTSRTTPNTTPEGVHSAYFDYYYPGNEWSSSHYHPDSTKREGLVYPDLVSGRREPHHAIRLEGYRSGWRTYRGMEEAFRRAFHNNLKRQRKIQMARRSLAKQYSRRGK